MKIHGLSRTRFYRIWYGIKDRCYSPKCKAYVNYGGRGITMHDDWRYNFMNFYKWAISNGYSDELEIDRIDNDLGYYPDNCRWTTRIENTKNRRIRSDNICGFKGVEKVNQKWRARLTRNGNKVKSQIFNTPEEASKKYNEWLTMNR